MKLKIQRKEKKIHGDFMESPKQAKDGGCDILVEDVSSVFEEAIKLLEAFPRFKEIIINTELTDDDQ